MHIFVAGGSTGIGRAIVEGLAGPGDDVLIGFRSSRKEAEAAREEVQARGARAHLIQEDLGTAGGASRAMAGAGELVPSLDVLVHSIVQPLGGRLLDLEPAQVAEVIGRTGHRCCIWCRPRSRCCARARP